MKNIRMLILGLVLAVGGLVAVGSTTTPASATCQVAPYIADTAPGDSTGSNWQGSWSKHYDPDCNGNTVADVYVAWHSYYDAGNLHMWYDMSITTGAIGGNKCVQISVDWSRPEGGHEDVQHMRNCKENSTRGMDAVNFNFDKNCGSGGYCSIAAWPVNFLEISMFDPDTNAVNNRVCPKHNGNATTTLDGCTSWNPNATWLSKGAKIRIRWNDGTTDENPPLNYDISNWINPNQ